jgi:DNA-cytosine methyltransferase
MTTPTGTLTPDALRYTFTIAQKPDAQMVHFFRDGQSMQTWRYPLGDTTVEQAAQRAVDGWNGAAKPPMRWGILCAGVGGFEFGIRAAGHRAVWAVEYDPDPKHGNQVAAEYHRRNHPDTLLINQDMRKVDVRELANIDALQISPPCQSFSTARNRDLPAREDVWVGLDVLRYVRELQPRIIIIENVSQYAKHAVCKQIVAGLLNMGYAVQQRVIDCADYGIPQTRKRLIIQARLDGQISWPAKSARRVGWYEAIADILPPPDKPLAPWQAKRWDAAYNALGPVYVDWQFAAARDPEHNKTVMTNRHDREPAATITANSNRQEVVCPILLDGQFIYDSGKDGDQAQSLIPFGKPAPTVMASDHSAKYIVYPVIVDNQLRQGEENGMKLFPITEPASTVMASNGSNKDVVYPAGPMRARLNAACSARLQTFPDDVILPASFSKAIRLIGNAVPPRLAMLLAECAEAGAEVWQQSLFGEVAA